MSKNDLSKIRRQEQIDAMKVIGLAEEQYINLGYDDLNVQYTSPGITCPQFIKIAVTFGPLTIYSQTSAANTALGGRTGTYYMSATNLVY